MNLAEEASLAKEQAPPFPKDGFWKAHHLRHLITGVIVFLLGVLADFSLYHWHHYRPRQVRWNNGTVQQDWKPCTLTNWLPLNVKFDMGVTEDGFMVLRVVQ